MDSTSSQLAPRFYLTPKPDTSQTYRQLASIVLRGSHAAPQTAPALPKPALGVALVRANVNLAVTKQALDHKSIAGTAIYTAPTDETAGTAVLNALASTF